MIDWFIVGLKFFIFYVVLPAVCLGAAFRVLLAALGSGK